MCWFLRPSSLLSLVFKVPVVEKLTVGAEVGCSVLVPETVEPAGFSFLSTGGRKINQGSTRVLAPSNLPENE